jgi:hypothetical protein
MNTSTLEIMLNEVSELECLVNIDGCSSEIIALVEELRRGLYEVYGQL